MITYTYDAWGKILKQTDSTMYNIANINPFKYRSYVYDNESGLYYLQSRYYDPTTGRFLNMDQFQYIGNDILSSNILTYCFNNYVNRVDNKGTKSISQIYIPNFDPVGPIISIAGAIANYSLRLTISKIATAFLHDRGWDVSAKMFQNALLGEGKTFAPDVSAMIVRLLYWSNCYCVEYKKTYLFIDLVKELAKGINGSHSVEIEFKSGDLHYSIQHCTLTSCYVMVNGRRFIYSVITDTYNFDNYRSLLNLL